jgi:hypothetical protein
MPVPNAVRDAQRMLAELDATHRHAVARLERATARRAAVVAEQDRLVEAAQKAVDQTVAAMATEVGADLTSALVGVEASAIRRLVRRASRDPRSPARSTPGRSDSAERPDTGTARAD